MSNKTSKTLTLAMGTAFAAGLAASNVASAAEAGANPFALNELPGGYMQLAGKEGQCGEGKCGAGKKASAKSKEGRCGEGKCGEGKCGAGNKAKAEDKAKQEGKCGEGKCGNMKK